MSELSVKMRKIRKIYKKCKQTEESQQGVYEWLCDNYYLYEREARWTRDEMRHMKLSLLRERGKRLREMCRKLVTDKESVTNEKVLSVLKGENPDNTEVCAFPVFYRETLLIEIFDSINLGDSEETRMRIAYATGELRCMRNLNTYKFSEAISPLNTVFAADPAGVYPRMTAGTRAEYRRRVAELARRRHVSESEYLAECMCLANTENKHIGEYLGFESCDTRRARLFIFLKPLLALVLCICTGLASGSAALATAAFLPLWAFAAKVISFFEVKTARTAPVLRMKNSDESVKNTKVMIVIPTIMPSAKEILGFQKHLASIYSSYERNENIRICVLTDFKSSDVEQTDEDPKSMDAFKTLIDEMCKTYENSFMGLVRKREYSKTQREFTGRERKRGAISDLASFMYDDKSVFVGVYGNTEALDETEYFMVLDSDTSLTFDSLTEMIACAVHPVNKKMYGVFSPAAKTKQYLHGMTRFTRLISGKGGVSSYSGASKDLYQDYFGTSVFCGKGLIDSRLFHEKLKGAFKEETVLSHDIVEGELLKTKFVSDTEISEGFPKTEISYFKRLDRWLRGDIQNIVFLFKGTENGLKFSAVSKYKIAENIRRAITPVFQLITLFVGSVSAPIIATVVVLLSLDRPIEIILLGQRAFVSLRATVNGLVRRFITHKNMLSWTTSAGSEHVSDSTLRKNIRYCLPGTLFGVCLMILPGITKLFGLCFVLNTFFSYYTASPYAKHKNIGFSEQKKLCGYARDAWQYYESFAGKTDNYLPPDNVQETPVYRVAHRTSPTNIGLMMLCTLAACDFGFIDSDEMYTRLENTLDTVMRLDKYRGNLYNWYDTKTLEVLKPAYISTVDSGNFVCMLTALKEGLREYEIKCNKTPKLRLMIEKLIDDTDLGFLYSEDAGLFRIGYSVSDDKFSESYYDLLMSEARMTGYYAVAKRIVPKEHMEKLSRIMSKSGRHKGPLSWTGTMFEFYLPHLLLPVYENSMSEYALKYCEYCQKKRASYAGVPFGMSESGFYSFDRQLSYQYKAHGVQKLGLKRGLDKDCVVSPYSTFLLLPFDPTFAFSNLDRLCEMDMEGKCGFYEAVDFTPGRTGEQDYMVVRSFMAHHVGMSLISLSNAAFNNIMQKRFMSDTDMSGAESFLMEEFPKHAPVFKDIELVPEQKKPERISGGVKRVENAGAFANSGRVFTNGEWTQVVFSNGMTRSIYRGLDMTVPPENSFDEYAGVRFFTEDTTSKKLHVQTPSKVIYRDTSVTFVSKEKGLMFTHTTGTHPRFCGETHVFTAKNMTGRIKKSRIYIRIDPFLSTEKHGLSHPAFTKIFMTDKIFSKEQCIIVTKNGGDGGGISLCAGLLHSDKVRVATSNIDFFRRRMRDGVLNKFEEINEEIREGSGVPDPCMVFEISLELKPGERGRTVLFMGAGSDEKECLSALSGTRHDFESSDGEAAFSPCLFFKNQSVRLLCEDLLALILCKNDFSNEQKEFIKCNTSSPAVLWKFGISGDNPIILLTLESGADIERAGMYVSIVSALKQHGITVDFVMCFDECGNYEAPIRHGLMSMIRGADEMVSGNLFPIDTASCTKSEITGLKAYADVIVGNEVKKHYGYLERFRPATPVKQSCDSELEIVGADFADDGFYVRGKSVLPWSHILCNRNFGTLVETGSLGFTWAFNSHENKLTKHNGFSWQRDDGERLFVFVNGKYYDVISGASVVFKNGCAEYYARIEKCFLKITVFVPKRGMTKRIRVEMKNTGDSDFTLKIGYLSQPVLGESRRRFETMTCEVYKNGLLVCGDNISPISGCAFFGIADNTMDFYNTDLKDVLSGNFDSMIPMPCAENCVFVGKNITLAQDEVFKITFSLSFGKSEKSAIFFGTDYNAEIPHYSSPLTVSTGDKSIDLMVNTWLPLQVIHSRIFAKTGFYQCGGAFGFRDQLQDAMNISLIDPGLCKEAILRCSCVQFEEGDVLHWWHNFENRDGGIRGIRTRCSDDMLWLPLALSRYVSESGDLEFLNTATHFIHGEKLKAGETEMYAHFGRSKQKATLYEHAKRAMFVGLNLGESGLIRMGSCDWNDGYSRVGANGDGTSVWVTMFYALVADSFAKVAEAAGDGEYAKDLRKTADELRGTVDRLAFRDGHYLRAFFDDGTQMSGIDSLPQSFATFCRMPDKERRMSALSCAIKELYDANRGVIRLFWPPLTPNDKVAGYVNFYAPGTRENGGQYTHAAVWLAEALLKEGFYDEAYRMLCDINPVNKYFTRESAERYLGEPFALAGDVYAAGSYAGRAGWTQYTGSAAWFWRMVVTDVLGIHKENGILSVTPHLPAVIPSYTATFEDGKNIHKIKVTR